MLVGHAWVSTQDQKLDLQTDALDRVGCERKYQDTLSGSKTYRPGLKAMLQYVRQGNTIVVWKLDRLARS